MISRRAFLKSGALTLFASGVGANPLFLNRAAAATLQTGNYGRHKTLVCIFQRGAMDGLMAVTPFADKHFTSMRQRLRMQPGTGDGSLYDLDGHFGLHPALSPFLRLYQDGQLAIVHGMGSPINSRSHFDAQDYMENGTPGRKGTASGWLNRAVGLLGHEPATPFQAVALTQALPKVFYGEHDCLAVADLEQFRVMPAHLNNNSGNAAQSFESLYAETAAELLRDTGQSSFEAMKLLSAKSVRSYVPEHDAKYPNSPLGKALRQIAFLIKADVGLDIAFAESGGWDTHVQQGTTNGSFARRARDLSAAMTAFWQDIKAHQDNVTLMTMTEFGRTVAENGSGGTDHGRASCAFVLGNQIKGGKVHGLVPELAVENLEDGRDLPVTTDFRALFSEVAGNQLGISNDAALFPGWQGERIPLWRS